MSDIEIARKTKLKDISLIARDLGIRDNDIVLYGRYKCKIDKGVDKYLSDKELGKLILVTAISPTPLGEGKTTISIALADGLRKINEKAILALREPSLGPVFGIKGGATGGGMVQIAPMEDINLHFTGDIHAMTTANNLLSAMIDNHIYFGNELGIERVVWKRCLDLNDRQLRIVETGLSDEKNIHKRMDKFDITVASEIMAIMCLSTDLVDLKNRLGRIIIGYNKAGKPIYAKDLKAEGSMTAILKDALRPNLVQTLEHTPALVHGGPFANIAHGCNSIMATNMALKLSPYVVTEAGFGADLGCEKFLDIKCRQMGIRPSVVVIVATIKALKYHGGVLKDEVFKENIEAIAKGMDNLYKHIDNIRGKFGLNIMVALNKYNQDSDKEIDFVRQKLEEKGVLLSVVTSYVDGGMGAVDLAQKVVSLSEKPASLNYMYDLTDDIKTKIKKVATKIYYANDVEYSEEALREIDELERLGFGNYPICIAKTQYSFSDDPHNLECLNDYNITIRSVEVKNGAGFIVVMAGKIMTMPGLPKEPAATKIDVDEKGNIVGIF